MAAFLALFIGCPEAARQFWTFLFTGIILAQQELGTITATSPAGVILPGAAITIAEDANGQSYL